MSAAVVDRLELVDRPALGARYGADDMVQAVVEVVVDQRTLGIGDGGLDHLQLLRDVEAGPPGLDHLDHALQVAGRAPQALGVRFVAPPSIAADVGRRLDLKAKLVPVADTRGLTKRDMIRNDMVAPINVDPETFRVSVDGQIIDSAPTERVALGMSYMLK